MPLPEVADLEDAEEVQGVVVLHFLGDVFEKADLPSEIWVGVLCQEGRRHPTAVHLLDFIVEAAFVA